MTLQVSRRRCTKFSGIDRTFCHPALRVSRKVPLPVTLLGDLSSSTYNFRIKYLPDNFLNSICRCAEEHRELARQQLLLLLKAGYSPLRFYVHDIRKYFYLGELLALVDLSLVSYSSKQKGCLSDPFHT